MCASAVNTTGTVNHLTRESGIAPSMHLRQRQRASDLLREFALDPPHVTLCCHTRHVLFFCKSQPTDCKTQLLSSEIEHCQQSVVLAPRPAELHLSERELAKQLPSPTASQRRNTSDLCGMFHVRPRRPCLPRPHMDPSVAHSGDCSLRLAPESCRNATKCKSRTHAALLPCRLRDSSKRVRCVRVEPESSLPKAP